MSRRVNKPIIGKEIARTASLIIEGASQNIVEGEVCVLDKNKDLLLAGATIADTDIIYIAVGTAATHDYTLPDGTDITGKRKLSYSAPIQGASVIVYNGLVADSAATERVTKVDITAAATFAPVVGTEYVLRIVYKDIHEHPGQFTQTFRFTAATTTEADLTNGMLAKINAYGPSGDIESRVIATNDTNDLVLTGKVIPDNATNDEIDEYSQVDFEVGIWSITSAGVKSDGWGDCAVTYTTNAHPGNGNPKLIRDIEKHARAYEGVTNLINFPVIKPSMVTDMVKWYDAIIVEHDTEYVSGDNQYVKETPITTEIYIPAGSGQTTDVLAVLNGWMASLPKAFTNVTV